MAMQYFTPRLPYQMEGENHNQAKKRRVRALLKLAEVGCPIFDESPVFVFDSSDWNGMDEARKACWKVANEMSKKAEVAVVIRMRDVPQ